MVQVTRVQPHQRCPDLPPSNHLHQLIRGNTETFPGQPRNINPPVCPGLSPGPPPGRACLETLPREAQGTQTTSTGVEEQQLYSQSLYSEIDESFAFWLSSLFATTDWLSIHSTADAAPISPSPRPWSRRHCSNVNTPTLVYNFVIGSSAAKYWCFKKMISLVESDL